jgi:hypothetical protein
LGHKQVKDSFHTDSLAYCGVLEPVQDKKSVCAHVCVLYYIIHIYTHTF